MKLKDIQLKDDNHFVAMQYYGLILNRTYLILITESHIIGVVGNGLISVQGRGSTLTSVITGNMAIHEDLMNPLSYLKDKYLERVNDLNLLKSNINKKHYANFRIKISEIIEVNHDPSKKWGMSYYPHDGKIYIKTKDKKMEFIILGKQSGSKIVKIIINKIANK